MAWIGRRKKKEVPDSPSTAPREAAPAEKPVRVSDFLSLKNVVFFPVGSSKQQVFDALVRTTNLPDPSLALQAIMAREQTGTTVIAPGLALPHARIQGLRTIVAALGLCPTGIVDPSSEGGPVRLFLLFLGPSENMRLHLAFLAGASSLFQVEGLSEALLQLTTPEAVIEKIRATEQSL
ncbi:MAG: PTS sugar transporter subunit IIA [Elusimicrobia bacterium]|nr:PTS sugar transporter subunit IIA [Elusimicrobiota bacterium]